MRYIESLSHTAYKWLITGSNPASKHFRFGLRDTRIIIMRSFCLSQFVPFASGSMKLCTPQTSYSYFKIKYFDTLRYYK